jgi:protein TonB
MNRRKRSPLWFIRQLFYRILTVIGAFTLTLAAFLVLPLMQTINKPLNADMIVHDVGTANVPPPPPPPEEPQEQEEQPEEAPPELDAEEAPPLDLSQLEMALNPGGFGDGVLEGDFAVKLSTVTSGGSDDVDALFSLSDLDQKPRVIYQPSPTLTRDVRKKTPGTVYILFIVNQQGRVESPTVQKSTDPVFERPALNAVKQWKFEPGKRNGKAVRFRMRVPISFPKG